MANAVNDVWFAALEQSLYGQQMFNTFALQLTAIPGGSTEEQLVTSLFADATGTYNATANLRLSLLAMQSDDVRHVAWHLRRVSPNPTQPFVVPLSTNVNGTSINEADTANVAMCISRRGLAAGRRNRGRIAVAGIPSLEMIDGSWSNIPTAQANTLGQRLIGSVTNTDGYTWTRGFWTPAHQGIANGQVVNYAALYIACTAFTVSSTVRVQRSRTVGVGS